jgi:hypothetical protein
VWGRKSDRVSEVEGAVVVRLVQVESGAHLALVRDLLVEYAASL